MRAKCLPCRTVTQHAAVLQSAQEGPCLWKLWPDSRLLAMEGTDEARELRAEPLPDRDFPDSALPDAGPPLLADPGALPEDVSVSAPRPPERCESWWSCCWRIHALTSMRLRGVVRSAEASDGSERLCRMLVSVLALPDESS